MLDAPAPDAVADARPVLGPVGPARDAVLRLAAAWAGVTIDRLRGAERGTMLVRARWAAIIVMRDGGMKSVRVGMALGRDHSTVLIGERKGRVLIGLDDNFAGLVRVLRAAWAAARSG
jgi:chromosomal replication initiation ATPase DnaA